eukprot:Gb_30856 [translate_table: standard]
MEFRKENRSFQTPSGFRLATVKEATQNLERVNPLLNKWDKVRLLDGWMSAPRDGEIQRPKVGYKHGLGYMLITTTSEISGERNSHMSEMYGEVSEEGKQAALLLCAEDLNYEVVDWLLNSAWPAVNVGNKKSGRHESEIDQRIEEFSQTVSRVAREFNGGARGSKTEERNESTSDSVARMVQYILDSDSLRQLKEYAFYDKLYDSFTFQRQIVEGVEYALPLKRDTESWDDDVLWNAITYVTTQKAVVSCIRSLLKLWRPLDVSKKIDMSVLYYVNRFIDETLLTDNEIRNHIYDAALQASGFEESHERDAMLKGVDVRDHILRLAAGEPNEQVVRKLLNCGVQPLVIDGQNKTALHHCAASSHPEAQLLRVAKVLLLESKESLAGACDENERTALHIASSSGHPLLCEFLLRHGATLNAKDQNGEIPLHYAVREGQKKVIHVLINREKIDPRVTSTSIVDSEDKKGKTPMDIAAAKDDLELFRMLLLRSKRAEEYCHKKDIGEILRQSVRKGYFDLADKLLENGADLLDSDADGKTTLHYAAESEEEEDAMSLFQRGYEGNRDFTRVLDKKRRTVLHVAAFHGHNMLCRELLGMNKKLYMCKDRDGQTPLHYAVKQNNEDVVKSLLVFPSKKRKHKIDSRDLSGKTPLHIAAAQGNLTLVKSLLSVFRDRPVDQEQYVRIGDFLGETALHKAARIGHKQIVEKLLQTGSRPLLERDCDGKTALHYAVQVDNRDDAVAIAELLINNCETKEEKSLLLWASAAGIGTAEESLTREKSVAGDPIKVFLEAEKGKTERDCNLVRIAARLGHLDMTKELLTRGGSISSLRNDDWKKSLHLNEKQNVEDVVKAITKITEQTCERPTLSDNLGRKGYADGLAALFLNPYVKSPITVGISGEWGMGKSSLMFRTEMILLKTAAQLAFPNLLAVHNDFPGVEELNLTKQGVEKCQKIKRSLELLLANDPEFKTEENILINFLENYQQKYRTVYKSLALVDRSDMIERNGKKSDLNNGGMTEEAVPAILTVRYNAWQYRNESEAWAGLAVEITKEMEETMTLAQWLSTCWRTHKRSIWVGLILPFLLLAILASCVTWLAWLLLDSSKQKGLKELKYGSLAATLLVIVWTVVKSIMAVLKPISSQIADYVSLPDHTEKLGYHQQVVNDIDLLKGEIGKPPYRLCTVIAFLWCWIGSDRSPNNVGDTAIPKMLPQFEGNLRIIVFVDDLDRCQESVILQVLTAINLVLAVCKIDVIIGMEKKMIDRAIIKKYGDKSNNKSKKRNEELADMFFQKIIQLPLDLPDPSDTESMKFLEGQLGSLQENSESLSGTPSTDNGGEISSCEEEGQSSGTKTLGPVGATVSDEPLRIYVTENGNEDKAPRSDQVVVNRGPLHIGACMGAIRKIFRNPADKNENEAGEMSQSTNKGDEGDEKKLKPVMSSQMFLPKYTLGERNAFCYLQTLATGSRRLPREWKRMLNYHRLVWNIFSKSEEAKSLAGWQVQLIAWIFVCWQWKDRINTLIEIWHKLDVLRNWKDSSEKPSMRVIVDRYIEDKQKSLEKIYHKEETVDVETEDGKERERHESRDRERGKKKDSKQVAVDEEELEDWKRLTESLSRYDVSMDGIQAFQKFRFYCMAGYLPWPISKKQ